MSIKKIIIYFITKLNYSPQEVLFIYPNTLVMRWLTEIQDLQRNMCHIRSLEIDRAMTVIVEHVLVSRTYNAVLPPRDRSRSFIKFHGKQCEII